MTLLFFDILTSLSLAPDLSPSHLNPRCDYFLISPSFLILLYPPTSSVSYLLALFKDTGLLKWNAGLSLDITANIRPVE